MGSSREPAPSHRVIGLGAEDRGDDAAGLLVARLLLPVAPPGVEVRECAGDAGALLGLLEGAERVVLVDAASGGRPGTVEKVPLDAVSHAPARSTHGLGLAEALAVAAELDLLPPDVRLYVVHGRRFEPGPVSPPVAAGARAAAGLILRRELAGSRPSFAMRAPGRSPLEVRPGRATMVEEGGPQTRDVAARR